MLCWQLRYAASVQLCLGVWEGCGGLLVVGGSPPQPPFLGCLDAAAVIGTDSVLRFIDSGSETMFDTDDTEPSVS